RARRREQPAVVRLEGAAVHDDVASVGEGAAEDELELPGLVAAEAGAREIVALGEDAGAGAPRVRDAVPRLERRRAVEEPHARQLGEAGRELGGAEAHASTPGNRKTRGSPRMTPSSA